MRGPIIYTNRATRAFERVHVPNGVRKESAVLICTIIVCGSVVGGDGSVLCVFEDLFLMRYVKFFM